MALIDCAKCCTIFSTIAFFFLLIIASLLNKQPLYFKGIDDAEAASQNCYKGALIYLGVLAASVAYWIFYNASIKAKEALTSATQARTAVASPRTPRKKRSTPRASEVTSGASSQKSPIGERKKRTKKTANKKYGSLADQEE